MTLGILLGAISSTFSFKRNITWAIACASLFAAILLLIINNKLGLILDSIRQDNLSIFIKVVVLSVALLNLMSGRHCKNRPEISVLALLSTLGMMFMISSDSLMTLYLSLELMSIPLYIMVASNSTESGLKYFILGAIASCIFLLGTSFIYGFTTCMNFGCIYDYYANLNGESIVMPVGFLLGFMLLLVAIAFKASAAPFHMWAPDVYQGAATSTTMFLASAPKVCVLLILAKLLIGPFNIMFFQWQQVVIFLAIASMIIGSFAAIAQSNIKRMMAYSSIGHVGFILCGLASAQNSDISAMISYTIVYSTMSIAVFIIIMLIEKVKGSEIQSIQDIAGLSKCSIPLALCMLVMMMSMAGIPPFAGFFVKYYVLTAIIDAQYYALSFIFIITAVVSAFYYLRIVKIAVFDPAHHLSVLNYKLSKLVLIIIAIAHCIYGIAPNYLSDMVYDILNSIIATAL